MENNREHLKASIHKGIESRILAHHKKQKRRTTAIIASVCLPVLLLTGWWLLPDAGSAPIIYVTKAGQYDTIYLHDGSRLTLAGNSSMAVTETDSGSTVELHQGECFFEIEKQKKNPFTVVTTDTRTTVLGTAFTVSKPDSSQPAEIRLKEGVVQISAFDHTSATLHPGERFFWRESLHTFAIDTVMASAIGNRNADRIFWDKVNIRQIKYHLENIFPITVNADTSVLAQNHQYSVSFNRSISIEDLLEILTLITSKEELAFQLNEENKQLLIRK